MMRFAATTAAVVLSSADPVVPAGWPEAPCQTCARRFAEAGGCEAESSGLDPMPMVPDGCADECGHMMGQMCMTLAKKSLPGANSSLPKIPAKRGIGNATLPEFSLATARAFASLAETSYCGPTANLTSWTCDPCRDAGLNIEPKPGYNDSVLMFQMPAFWTPFARFAYAARLGPNAGPGPLANGCVLAIRGSSNTANFLKDFELGRTRLDVCEGCSAHYGFLTFWREIEKDIQDTLARLGCVPGGDPLFVTGHSLGAAVATIAAVELVAMGFDVRAAYLFESPRVGNGAFAEFFDSYFQGKDVWRITHGRDPIPSGPYGFGYAHTGQEVYFDSNDNHHVCSSYQECEQHKPYFRLYPSDHCKTPLVPQQDAVGAPSDICHCRGFLPLGQSEVV